MGKRAWSVSKARAARLATGDRCGPFDLGPPRSAGIFDRYLDSRERGLWNRGLLARLRRRGEHDAGHGALTVFRRRGMGWEALAEIELRSAFSWQSVSRNLAPAVAALLEPAMGSWADPWLTVIRSTVLRAVSSGNRQVAEIAVEHAWQAAIGGRPVRTVTLEFGSRATPLERQALVDLLEDGGAWPLEGDLPAEALQCLATTGIAPPFGFWRRLALATGAAEAPEREGVSGRIGHAEDLTLADVAVILRDRVRMARRLYREAPEDTESLHDLRVVIRRLRSLLGRAADARRKAGAARKALGRLADITSPARDADVMLDLAFELAPGGTLRADLAPFLADLFVRREQAHEAVCKALCGKPWRLADAALRAFLAKDAGLPSDLATPAEASAVLEPLHAAVATIAVPNTPPDTLHCLRLAVKRLRYAIESGTLALPEGPAATAAHALSEAQSTLGRHHDLILLEQAAAAFGLRLAALESLAERIAAEDERLRRDLEIGLPHIQSPAFLERLALRPGTRAAPPDSGRPARRSRPRPPETATPPPDATTSSAAPRASRRPSPSPGSAGRAPARSPRRARRPPDRPAP